MAVGTRLKEIATEALLPAPSSQGPYSQPLGCSTGWSQQAVPEIDEVGRAEKSSRANSTEHCGSAYCQAPSSSSSRGWHLFKYAR